MITRWQSLSLFQGEGYGNGNGLARASCHRRNEVEWWTESIWVLRWQSLLSCQTGITFVLSTTNAKILTHMESWRNGGDEAQLISSASIHCSFSFSFTTTTTTTTTRHWVYIGSLNLTCKVCCFSSTCPLSSSSCVPSHAHDLDVKISSSQKSRVFNVHTLTWRHSLATQLCSFIPSYGITSLFSKPLSFRPRQTSLLAG